MPMRLWTTVSEEAHSHLAPNLNLPTVPQTINAPASPFYPTTPVMRQKCDMDFTPVFKK